MCLIAFAWQVNDQPLLLLGNRDEFHARPTRAAQFWTEEGHADMLAGKDLQAGGSWLGVTRSGRFAALTNVRAPGAQRDGKSRGHLIHNYLTGDQDPHSYLQRLQAAAADYADFNLLVGNRMELWFFHSRDAQLLPVPPGVHGLSNASLDTPWPKTRRLCQDLADNLGAGDDQLLTLLARHERYPDAQLPETGISRDWERMLSAAFIVSPDYGTRASTVVRLDATGGISFRERQFNPAGESVGEQAWSFSASG
ncbi:MAG: NRDE family protein [Gammaproteobacteria bacterium]|nr:NRDE family protein [Gammaproteobacteria bacterium]